ncbi:hypothetical protein C8J56DRAFT_1058139 [Mycena floridula]|nr:hypothetical protein C8J56DRAFT_1058139 [Mycena floridula]
MIQEHRHPLAQESVVFSNFPDFCAVATAAGHSATEERKRDQRRKMAVISFTW